MELQQQQQVETVELVPLLGEDNMLGMVAQEEVDTILGMVAQAHLVVRELLVVVQEEMVVIQVHLVVQEVLEVQEIVTHLIVLEWELVEMVVMDM